LLAVGKVAMVGVLDRWEWLRWNAVQTYLLEEKTVGSMAALCGVNKAILAQTWRPSASERVKETTGERHLERTQ
jgi:hypothetical protein